MKKIQQTILLAAIAKAQVGGIKKNKRRSTKTQKKRE